MASLHDRLDHVALEGATASDKLRQLFALAGDQERLPSRQRICDFLAGRRQLPPAAERHLQVLEMRARLHLRLEGAWAKHGTKILWSMNPQSACDPSLAHLVARELQHGNMEALRDAREIMEMKSALDRLEAREDAFA